MFCSLVSDLPPGATIPHFLAYGRYRGGDAEEMAWMADSNGEQGTKSSYRENGSDGQQQERNKGKHQRQPRHEPQTITLIFN